MVRREITALFNCNCSQQFSSPVFCCVTALQVVDIRCHQAVCLA